MREYWIVRKNDFRDTVGGPSEDEDWAIDHCPNGCVVIEKQEGCYPIVVWERQMSEDNCSCGGNIMPVVDVPNRPIHFFSFLRECVTCHRVYHTNKE